MIEQDLSRIAAALERIASHLDHPPAAAVSATEGFALTVPAGSVASIATARASKVVQDQPPPSLEDLRARMRALSNTGPNKRETVIGVLKELGVPTLAKLGEDRYPELAQRLSALEAA